MATIEELSSEQIKNPDIFEKVEELAAPFIFHGQAKEAYDVQEKLISLLKLSELEDSDPDLFKDYQNLLVQLKWTALPIISEDEFLKLLKQNYLTALKNEDVDALNRLEAKMFSVGLMPRKDLREKIHKAIRENEEKLGDRTIGEWLDDYAKTIEPSERTTISHLDYVSKSDEAQVLPEKEKNILRKILWTFDNLLLATPVMSEPLLSDTYKMIVGIGVPRKPLPIPKPIPPEELIKEPEPIEPKRPEKPQPAADQPASRQGGPKTGKKPGLFKRLFGKKPKKPKEKVKKELIPPKIKEASQRLKKIPSVYEGRISPYERKEEEEKPTHIGRIIPPLPKPSIEKEIPTFPEEFEKKAKSREPVSQKQEELKKPKASPALVQKADIKGKYKIRTMKKDIEKAKGQIAPSKTKPRVKNNVVDLSGK